MPKTLTEAPVRRSTRPNSRSADPRGEEQMNSQRGRTIALIAAPIAVVAAISTAAYLLIRRWNGEDDMPASR